jgi:cyclophilin family peptidyl-prolyl cis-trans isomerase
MRGLFRNLIFIGTMILCGQTIAQQESPKVLMETDLGEIVIQLYPQSAPVTVDNFINYVKDNFYDGVIFHRVIKDFMIQAGGYRFDLTPKKPNRKAIVNESNNGLKNLRGTVAMARTSAPNSATSQFFINHKDNSFLDYQEKRAGYAVFGKVVKGMDTIDKIAAAKTESRRPFANLPEQIIAIRSVRLISSIPQEQKTEPAKSNPLSPEK